MKQLSLSKKLILGFGILMAIYVCFSVYVHKAVADQNFATKDAESWMKISTVVIKIDNHMTSVKNMVVLSTKTKAGSDELKEIQAELSKEKAGVDEAFADYKKLLDATPYETEEERQSDLEIFNNEVKLWKEYIAVLEPAEAMIAAGKQQEALAAINGDVETKLQAAMKAVADDIKNCEEGTEASVTKADAIYDTVTTVLTVVTVAAVAFIVLVNVLLSRSITTSANELVRVTDLVTQGDLRSKVALEGNDEFCRIGDGLNHMIDSVRKMCGQIQSTSQQVAAASEELTASAQQSADATHSVAESVTEVAASSAAQTQELGEADARAADLLAGMEKMAEAVEESMKSVHEAVGKAKEGNKLATETIGEMNGVTDTVLESADRVARLGERSKEIGQIVSVISGIAGQTNLLALNAAIEAARAGEQGRGFAVVAEEIRKLAEESQGAAQRISDLIHGIQAETEDAVNAMNKGAKAAEDGKANLSHTGEAFDQILERVNMVQASSALISDTVRELKVPIDDIVRLTGEVSEQANRVTEESQNVSAATEQQAAGIQEIADASRTLAGHAQDLQDTALQFKL